MPAAIQLAEWIIRYRADNGAPIDPVSLQKMLFYAQAFRLARYGERLFSERIKAWTHGPVIPQVWHRFSQDMSGVILPSDNTAAPQIDEELEMSLKNSVDFFSRFSTFAISDATHNEDPWRETWTQKGSEQSPTIPVELIKRYYAELISDGENALSRAEALDVVPEPRLGFYYRAGICARGMRRHPLYVMRLAEAFAEPVPEEEALPPTAFAAITRREFVTVSDP